jgi:hypothetical protein
MTKITRLGVVGRLGSGSRGRARARPAGGGRGRAARRSVGGSRGRRRRAAASGPCSRRARGCGGEAARPSPGRLCGAVRARLEKS